MPKVEFSVLNSQFSISIRPPVSASASREDSWHLRRTRGVSRGDSEIRNPKSEI